MNGLLHPDPIQVTEESPPTRLETRATGHVVKAYDLFLGRFAKKDYAEEVAGRVRAVLTRDRAEVATQPEQGETHSAFVARKVAKLREDGEAAAGSLSLYEPLRAKLGALDDESLEEALDRVLATLGDAVEKSEVQNRDYFEDAMKATELAGVHPTKSFREVVLHMKSVNDSQKRHIAALQAELFKVEQLTDPSYIAKKFRDDLERVAREGIAKLRARLPFPL